MPVIDITLEELRRLSGLERPDDWFIETIPMTGASFEGGGDGVLRFEFFPNRPDHYSVEGVARTLRSLYADEPFVPSYTVSSGDRRILVDASVSNVRPVIVGAVLGDLHFSDGMLKSIIDLQEKLHLTVGRKRRKVAIGIHDLRRVSFPFTYAALGGDDYSFSPLGYAEEMKLAKITEVHEKGREYGWILDRGRYPLITDAEGKVLSMPPVINGNLTQLTEDTTDVFVDVTGTSLDACSGVLNIIAAALADRGGSIGDVLVTQGASERRTPNLARRQMRVSLREMNTLMGIRVDAQQAALLLARMGHDCKAGEREISVGVPPYRMDIMHPVDLIEDAAISYGFGRFGAASPAEQTVGGLTEVTSVSDLLSELLIGYGYTQVVTFMISGRTFEAGRMRVEAKPSVDLLNPILEERDMLRTSLLPGMLLLLEANKHNELPQRIFEIGDVHIPDRRSYFAAVSMHPKATFAECKSLADAARRDMKADFRLGPSHDPRFIEGRQMSMHAGGEQVGILGELHPEVITNFNLYNPIAAIEFDLRRVTKLR